MYKVDAKTNFNKKLGAISKQIETLVNAQAQSAPINFSSDDNACTPWDDQFEEAKFLYQRKHDLRPNMQDSLVNYMVKVGYPCMGCFSKLHG